ncbi:MAG: hypothetical protein AAB400_02650 [Patescibacteria group bacterium]
MEVNLQCAVFVLSYSIQCFLLHASVVSRRGGGHAPHAALILVVQMIAAVRYAFTKAVMDMYVMYVLM